MRAIGYIAVNVFKESVRDKVLYNLVFFAVLLIGVSYLLGQLTAGQDIKIIKDLGLAAMSVFGLFIAVFIGIGLVSKEVERRSIYSLLSKPISRQQFIIGKYLGLVLTLLVNIAVMTAAYYAVLAGMAAAAGGWLMPGWEAPAVDPALLKAVSMIFLQLAIMTALALLFSTFSSPMLAAALTFGLYIVGHFNADLKHFETIVSSRPLIYLARALYYLLPNLAPLDVKMQVVHALPVPAAYLMLNAGYALVYISARCSRRRRASSCAAISSDATRPFSDIPGGSGGLAGRRGGHPSPARSRLRGERTREPSPVCRFGPRHGKGGAFLRCRARRCVLGARAATLWRRSAASGSPEAV